jgi:aspartyl-tRNA(Asn)/glutamyl-tRNA(Gln) amidotransferase subunit C
MVNFPLNQSSKKEYHWIQVSENIPGMEKSMSLDQTTVKRIATLARLKLNNDRMGPMQQDLNRILHFIDQLNEVETTNVEAMAGVNIPSMPWRQDVVNDGDKVDEVLANAPETACNMFVVPKVVE